MSVLVIVVGAVRIICVDRGAVWSWCQLLAIFMSNGEFYFKCKGIMRLALLFSRCCLSRCDCEQSSVCHSTAEQIKGRICSVECENSSSEPGL